MPLMTWNDKLEVKVASIDNQHKKLVDMINELHDAMSMGKGQEVVGKVLSGLIVYTAEHFAYEEGLMKKFQYPAAPAHIKQHEELKKTALDIKSKYEGGQMRLTLELSNFLKNWLNTHITGTDMQFGKFLEDKPL